MWDRVFMAQSRLFAIYGTMMQTANTSMAAAMENTARLQRRQVDLLREAIDHYSSLTSQAWSQPMTEFLEQQSRLAAEQSSRSLDIWREFVGAAAEAEDATIFAAQGEVRRAIDSTKQATDTARETGKSAMAAAQKAWSGTERRKKIMMPYSGQERRKAA